MNNLCSCPKMLNELKQLGQSFADLYSQFAAESFDSHTKKRQGSPKLHTCVHLCEWQAAEWGNPRAAWCYSDEDMIGLMATVAESCHPKSMAVMTLWKWLLGVYEINQ